MKILSYIFIVLAAVTWLIGGNILVMFHYKRRGMNPWSGFTPFVFPFSKFNLKEWLWLLFLFIITFAFCFIAILIQ